MTFIWRNNRNTFKKRNIALCSLFGGDFIWQFFVLPPNLNNTNIYFSYYTYVCIYSSYSFSPNQSNTNNDYRPIRQIFDSPINLLNNIQYIADVPALMVSHNHGCKNSGHRHHSYEENIMMVLIILIPTNGFSKLSVMNKELV